MRAHPVGKGSVVAHDGGLDSGAKVMLAANAELAMQTTFHVPADTDTLTDAKILVVRGFAESSHTSDGFMSGNEWIDRRPPLIVEHR